MIKKTSLHICGNWKMNHTPASIEAFFNEFTQLFENLPEDIQTDLKKSELFCAEIYAPLLFLAFSKTCSDVLYNRTGFRINIGSQNVHWEKGGAFTGEVSAEMLKSIGIQHTLIAHSERRQYFGETNTTAAKRLESSLTQDLIPMLCIGETKAERENGQTKEVLRSQLAAILPLLSSLPNAPRLRIAYEPVWAIGTGLVASLSEANDAHQFISETIRTYLLQNSLTFPIPILYGGSVTPDSSGALLHSSEIHGALIGGASLKAKSFLEIMLSGR